MPPKTKRKYNNAKRKTAKRYGVKTGKANVSAATLQAAIRRTLYKEAETKQSQSDISDYQQISHNSFINIFPNNLLNTTPGVNDPTQGNTQNRIGDKITLLKCSIKMMLELNERYSDVTFRIMVVKSARGDTPTVSTLFKGLSGNKMLDEVNYEKYSIIHQRWIKMKAPPLSIGYTVGLDGTSSGINYSAENRLFNSRATRTVIISIPGTAFAKDGIIQYEGPTNGNLQKFYDYNVFVYAYSNYSTSSALGYYVGAVNDAFVRLSYKDL